MSALKRPMLAALAGIVWSATSWAGLEVTKSIKDNLTSVPSGQTFTYKIQYRAASTTTDFFGAYLVDVLPGGGGLPVARRHGPCGQFQLQCGDARAAHQLH